MPRKGENIHKRKDGRWEGRYIKSHTNNGKAIYGSVYAKTYQEVKRKLILATQNVILNQAVPNERRVFFREILYEWLENKRLQIKDQTYAKYLYLIENHILPSMGSIKAQQIDSISVNRFLAEKSCKGRLDGKGGLSSSYIRTISFILTSTLDYAAKKGYGLPLTEKINKPSRAKKTIEVFTVPEQLRLESFLLQDLDDKKLGVLLSLYTGIRIGELCGLKNEDIDLETRTIHIQRTVERIRNIGEGHESKTSLVVGDVKSISSNRIIPIPQNLFEFLSSFKKERQEFLVEGKTYSYIDPRTYQYAFQKYLKTTNTKIVNFHALRHTFATRCIESGMDTKTLSEILGHSSVSITLNTYVHSSLELKQKQLNTMALYCGQK